MCSGRNRNLFIELNFWWCNSNMPGVREREKKIIVWGTRKFSIYFIFDEFFSIYFVKILSTIYPNFYIIKILTYNKFFFFHTESFTSSVPWWRSQYHRCWFLRLSRPWPLYSWLVEWPSRCLFLRGRQRQLLRRLLPLPPLPGWFPV